ncbi:MAG: branched-chain amino acid ABC transporter permease [Rhodospirillaceae bacterium]
MGWLGSGGDGRRSLTVYLNIVANGLLTGLVYGLAALGLSLIFTVTRVVNFAHGGLMVLGFSGATALAARYGVDPLLAMPAVTAGLFLGGFLAYRLLIGHIAATPERRRTLMSLGLALVLAAALAILPEPTVTAAPRPADALAFGPLLLDRVELRAALMAVIVTALLALFFNLSRTGKAIRACADNPFGARVIGLNLQRLQAATFGLGAAIAGIAGCLLAQSGSARPGSPADLLLLGLIVALTGGLGSVEGALLGGMAVGVAEALGGAVLGSSLEALSGIAVVLLVLAVRPHGLSGRAE